MTVSRAPRSGGPLSAGEDARDRGTTLIEILTMVVLIGVLTIAVAAGIVVILDTDEGVGRIVGESHDHQQLVNYLVSDVASGPYDPAAYVTDPAVASGCAVVTPETGYNVLRFDSVDSETGHATRVAYRVSDAPDGGAKLDRVACTDGGSGTFGAGVAINIADLLAPVQGSDLPVEVDIAEVAGAVRTVTLGLDRVGGEVAEVSASPRTSPPVASLMSGPCPPNPFDQTSGFLAFVQDSTRLQDGADSYGAIATKSFSWGNGARFSMGPDRKNTEFDLPGYTPDDMTALYVVNALDWAASSGMLELNSGGMVTVGDFSNSIYATAASNHTRLEPSGGSSTTYVFNQSAAQRADSNPVLRSSSPLDLDGAFELLEMVSLGVAELPGACPNSNHVTLLDQNGAGPYPGSGNLKARYTIDNVNVLNVTMAELRALGAWSEADSSPKPGDSGTQVVINVADAGAVTFDAPILGMQNYPRYVMYNFPNATSIAVSGTLWGSLVAPNATVTTNGNDLRGGVIAKHLIVSGGVIDVNRQYTGVFPW